MKQIRLTASSVGSLIKLFPDAESAYYISISQNKEALLSACDVLNICLKPNETCYVEWHGCEFALEDNHTCICVNYVSFMLENEEPIFGWTIRDDLPFKNCEIDGLKVELVEAIDVPLDESKLYYESSFE